MSDVDNRAANLMISDDDCPSIQARPDTDEEFWLHHWNSRNARRQDKEKTPNQLLHEAQRDRILDYFYHSKALDASPEEVEKWVDNLIAADPDAFVPDLFSDEDSNYSEEEFVVDKEYADMLRSESKESKKKFWLVQQCLQYRRKLQKRRRRGYDTPSDYNSAAFWGDGREFWGQNPYEEGGGELDTPTANERTAQNNEEGGAPPNEPEAEYETADDLDLQQSAEEAYETADSLIPTEDVSSPLESEKEEANNEEVGAPPTAFLLDDQTQPKQRNKKRRRRTALDLLHEQAKKCPDLRRLNRDKG